MADILVDKNQIRNLIERKKAQILNFQKDMTRPDDEQTFSKEEYAQKCKDIQGDIDELEATL